MSLDPETQKALVVALESIHTELMNLQPHIPTSCPDGAGFIDAHVDKVLEIASAALNLVSPLMRRTD